EPVFLYRRPFAACGKRSRRHAQQRSHDGAAPGYSRRPPAGMCYLRLLVVAGCESSFQVEPRDSLTVTANCSLSTLEAYDRWAASYPPEAHNPLMRVEQQAMLAHWPDVAGCCALDLACGTGRYASLLAQTGAQRVVAADFSTAMLRQVSVGAPVRANMMQLPFVG